MQFKLFAVAFAVVVPFAAFGQVVWDQEPNADGLGIYSDGISTNGSQAAKQAIADNFTLSSTADITDITFWGSSTNFVAPDLSNFSAFDIDIYNSSFTQVGAFRPLTASLNPVDTGNQNVAGGEIYQFDLFTSLNLSAGNYFLHVGSINVDPNGDSFVWADAASGDNSFAANFFDSNGWQTDTGGGDLAFKLTATPAPEPVSVALLAFGALGLLRRRRA